MTRHSARASPALQALNETDPAMAALALWCDHRDSDAAPMALTAGTTIHYGPAFDTLPRHEQIGLAAHHILHVGLRHPGRLATMAERMGDRFDADLWNIAADALVNETLLHAGYALPRPALTLTGLLAQSLSLTTTPRDTLAEWDVDRLYLRLRQGGGGTSSPGEAAKAYAASLGQSADLHPDAPDDSAPNRATDADWRRHLTRALEAGRMAGRGIGAIGLRLADLPQSETPWEVVLRGLVTRAVTQTPRQTHRRPARQWIAAEAEARRTNSPSPAFQPGTARATPAPRIVVALDCSSSIDSSTLAILMAEVAGIARRAVAEIHLLPFDDALHAPVLLDPSSWRTQLAQLALSRDGGTDFAPPFAAAIGLSPSILIVLTDLEATLPPVPKALPVIWAVPDARQITPPPYGHLLDLSR
jgi:predicted metal-dependent peptidase